MSYRVDYRHPGLGARSSSHWQLETDAQNYRDGLPKAWNGVVVKTQRTPEIFRHCGPADDRRNPSQAIGGKCFTCGIVLTRQHAREVDQ